MFCLCLFLLPILTVTGTSCNYSPGADPEPRSTDPRCANRLDVISYSEWPILGGFNRELTDNAVFVSIAWDYHDGDHTRAVLHDGRNKTYLYDVYPYFDTSNGLNITRELVEISGLAVKDIKFGAGSIIILTEDGSVWTAGENYYGQLSGDTADRPTFTKVQGLPTVKKIAAGYFHCIVLTEDGELFSWGRGFQGALGRIPVNFRANPTPTIFSLGQGASLPTSICCMYDACMALTESAEVFTWGYPYRIGRLGENRLPGHVQGIPSEETIIKVVCGIEHMVALTSSGRLYGWGFNYYGELLQAIIGTRHATELNLGGKVVRDVVAGRTLTIVRTDTERVYYFGWYDGHRNRNVTQLEGNLHPRDLMAKTANGQDSYGVVSLGCE